MECGARWKPRHPWHGWRAHAGRRDPDTRRPISRDRSRLRIVPEDLLRCERRLEPLSHLGLDPKCGPDRAHSESRNRRAQPRHRTTRRARARRAWLRVGPRAPDLLVDVRLGVQREWAMAIETSAIDQLSSLHFAPSYQVQTATKRFETYERPRLVVIATDTRRGLIVWKGALEERFRGQFPAKHCMTRLRGSGTPRRACPAPHVNRDRTI
jgi:hypothetical protein